MQWKQKDTSKLGSISAAKPDVIQMPGTQRRRHSVVLAQVAQQVIIWISTYLSHSLCQGF